MLVNEYLVSRHTYIYPLAFSGNKSIGNIFFKIYNKMVNKKALENSSNDKTKYCHEFKISNLFVIILNIE